MLIKVNVILGLKTFDTMMFTFVNSSIQKSICLCCFNYFNDNSAMFLKQINIVISCWVIISSIRAQLLGYNIIH